MKTILFVCVLGCMSSSLMAQSASILLLPETGVSTNKTTYQPNHKITVKTQAGNYGLIQQAGPIEVGTFIGEANGGYASYGTTGAYNLCLSTNAEEPQVMLTTLNFMGIGGTPFNALHVYGGAQIYGAANTNVYTTNSFLKADNDGKLTPGLQTGYYSLPRSAFQPLILSDENSIAESADGGIYYTLSKVTIDWLEAPINLPVGAIITGVEFYFIDNSTANLTFMLTSSILGFKNDIANALLSSDNTSPDVRKIANNTINNGSGVPVFGDTTYQLRIGSYDSAANKAWDGINTQVISAKITYKY